MFVVHCLALPLLQSISKWLLTLTPVVQAHAKGSSLMQPLRPQAAQPSLGALGSAAFAALAAADVGPEADFFQKYQACSQSWLHPRSSHLLHQAHSFSCLATSH